ncbi:hypothetical protein [Roseicyclus marinus]|uniref:hypothetical protein n=1 Tax=Roseicyclus marinus TaxID=2161673 RepID=UPI00241031FC|nr:hypothetical protein [Roseicyclus marinus]MDG3040047.1 hypothetical protein [Roseicyclus marinus]
MHRPLPLPPGRRVTGLRGHRLFAWFTGWIAGGIAITVIFFPLFAATLDTERSYGAALRAWFDNGAFFAVLPGVFLWAVFLGPVWLVLRIWIARRGDHPIGPRPATLPVWLAIWVVFTVIEVLLAGPEANRTPPGPFALVPPPFDLMVGGALLVKIGGVAVMFAVYRRMRPRDAIDRGETGPFISSR